MRDIATRKWLEVARFEVAYQLRRRTTWVLGGLFLLPLTGVTLDDLVEARGREALFHAPLAVAQHSAILGLVALLVLAAVIGNAATRDVRTRLEPLVHAAPVGASAYVVGRFLGTFAVAAMITSAVPLVHLLVPLVRPDLAGGVVGPILPASYLWTWLLVVLPNAFVVTAILFALGTRARHPMGAWVGAAVVFVGVQLAHSWLGDAMGRWDLASLFDPGGTTTLEWMARTRSPAELGERWIGAGGSLLWNRALWLALASALIVATARRFDFGGRAGAVRWWQRGPLRAGRGRGEAGATPPEPLPGLAGAPAGPLVVPRPPRAFGPATRVRQTLSVVRDSLRELTPPWVWPALAALVGLQVLITRQVLGSLGAGSPVLPTTALVMRTLGPDTGDTPPPVVLAAIMVPVLLAGELIWRERDAGMEALADAAPVPDGIRFLGKLLALWLALVVLVGLRVVGGLLAHASLGWHGFDPALQLALLGLGVVNPLVFGLFAMAVHVLVNRKHVGHVVPLLLLATPIATAGLLGMDHPLLVVGSGPGWTYSDISGFGASLGPALWFHAYWAAWAVLAALVARLFWVRGVERGAADRLRLARRRLTGARLGGLVAAGALVLLVGGFLFYETSVVRAWTTAAGETEARAEYERRYGRFEGAPRPTVTALDVEVDLHPGRREAELRGVHRLVNATGRPIDTLHVAVSTGVETGTVELDRPARAAVVDDALGHRIYVLGSPLAPGDSLRMGWEVRHVPRGFPGRNGEAPVVGNGSFIVLSSWMPLVGYQRRRELAGAAERVEEGLPLRPAVPSLDDAEARRSDMGVERVDLTVTVATDEDQVAIAPGRRVREWTEGGRRRFRYESPGHLGGDYAVFSADYAVRTSRWEDVALEVVHHPAHDHNVDRMLRGMEASLDQLTERFGPYPYDVLRMVEYPSEGGALHASAGSVWYQELFSLFDPERDPRGIDMPFAVTAHEVAHQFQPMPAPVEGRALLSESFAWYAAMGVVEEEYGPEHLARFLAFMRRAYLTPRSRADVPLLRAADFFLAYRKGPFAMYALREYVGQAEVDRAWRRVRERHASGEPPFATSLDLYRELRAVTPDSLQTLLGDLLERNTFWELTTTAATAEPAPDGAWRVRLDVEARKVAVDTAGTETELPMDDPVEIGVWGPEGDGGGSAPSYRAMHRIRSGPQTLTVTVPERPARAGIDPRHLLIDVRPGDNVVAVEEPSPERD